jgi:cytochrome b6-f complex iron-sulfur subunit
VTTANRQLPNVITLSSEQVSEPSRRQFCAHACQAASLVAVSAFLPACGGGEDSNPAGPSGGGGTTSALPVINGTVAGRTVSVPVSGSLANPGSAALVQVPATVQPNVFLVFRDSATAFTALTAVCTHEGCTVDSFNGQLYTCPCHGSKYTTAGGVANGPANSPLRVFPSTLAGTTLTFNI